MVHSTPALPVVVDVCRSRWIVTKLTGVWLKKDGTSNVLGDGRQFESATQAIETYREELGVIDQDLPGFVIAKDGKPVGTIEDGDSVILFNFRGDRAQEISLAFDTDESFDKFRIVYASRM